MLLTLVLVLLPASRSLGTVPGRSGAIAFSSFSGHGIYSVGLHSGAPEQLTNGGFSPSYSPDGSLLAFSADGAIAVVGSDGSGLRLLTSGVGFDETPAFSPAGDLLVFAHTVERHDQDLYEIGLDGSGLRLLLGGPTRDQSPTFSPGGARIAFVRSSGYDADIWTVSADGTGARRLTRDPRGQPNLRQESPDYSPDGRQIVFIQGNKVAIMRADGSGARVLTDPASGLRAGGPVFSPDGRWIAFWTTRRSAASTRTWVMKRDGSGLRMLNTGGLAAGEPTWQPLPGA
jgi:Tol biopolymer transport system component